MAVDVLVNFDFAGSHGHCFLSVIFRESCAYDSLKRSRTFTEIIWRFNILYLGGNIGLGQIRFLSIVAKFITANTAAPVSSHHPNPSMFVRLRLWHHLYSSFNIL